MNISDEGLRLIKSFEGYLTKQPDGYFDCSRERDAGVVGAGDVINFVALSLWR